MTTPVPTLPGARDVPAEAIDWVETVIRRIGWPSEEEASLLSQD
jgi:hypothetical protein